MASRQSLFWLTILRKREAFHKAFHHFDPHTVARFNDKDITRLLADPGVVRSRAKMENSGEDFATWIWSLVGNIPILNQWTTSSEVRAKTPLSEEISAALKKRGFKFVGPVITYAWMQATGIVNDHATTCFRYRDKMPLTVARGRTGSGLPTIHSEFITATTPLDDLLGLIPSAENCSGR